MGWHCESVSGVVDDTGEQYDLLEVSPALVVVAVHRSVERWRLRRCCEELPAAVPTGLGMPVEDGWQVKDNVMLARKGWRKSIAKQVAARGARLMRVGGATDGRR